MKRVTTILAMMILSMILAGGCKSTDPDRGTIPNVDQPINPGLTNEWEKVKVPA